MYVVFHPPIIQLWRQYGHHTTGGLNVFLCLIVSRNNSLQMLGASNNHIGDAGAVLIGNALAYVFPRQFLSMFLYFSRINVFLGVSVLWQTKEQIASIEPVSQPDW
jgi:hypothetical protein